MILSRAELILFWGVTDMLISSVTTCSWTDRNREDRALKKCLGHWNVYTDTNVIDLQKTLFGANLTHVCQNDAIEAADHCVTTVPVHRCPMVLLFWRHFIDPISQACNNINDFTHSLVCIDKKQLKMCQGIANNLGPYSRRRSVRKKECGTISNYKTCMNQIIKKDPDCKSNAIGPLENTIGLHLLHLGVYYKCSQDFPLVLQPVDTLQGLPYNTPLGYESDFFD
ncbi:uncharacterized protein LOC125683056 isoform X2 [Ostrea edulis]|uniref:uncharacterized protein LOC125683056 isoform X2 n=1 Tax=Ostrea edulis TaxID=37623 RepID=UPI0024AFE62D|nr:uncharacterized protein LOC125683056 isoform X2 [Ostrea edulis]